MGTLRREQESVKRIAADEAGIERVASLQSARTAKHADNFCGSKQA